MKNKPKDRHLDIPSEANRDKHINFKALESDDPDPADLPDTGTLADNDADNYTFDFVVDEIPYLVKATPFNFNEETRYYVAINGGMEHVFVWDQQIPGFSAIDEQPGTLPASLETAISKELLLRVFR